MYDVTKLRTYFPATTVYKDPAIMATFRSAGIPAFLRDWILKRKAGPDGHIDDPSELSNYVASIIPHREEKGRLEDEARTDGETRKFLARIGIRFDSRSNYYTFEIPDLGFTHGQTLIEDYIWDRVKEDLIGAAGGWGLVKIGYIPPEGKKKNGKFTLLDYKNFCPYEVDLDSFREARSYFEADEWMDIILGAIDYNPDGYCGVDEAKDSYEVWEAKHTMLTRLLPFIEPRINLVELAPKGTGKSYLFGRVGKYGWLASGGTLTRAKLFYDVAARQPGLIVSSDFVAMDEIQSIRFDDPSEMQGALKGYLESGEATFGKNKIIGKAGVILLGNIPRLDMDASKDMFKTLPEVFHESALLDRFHGFIQGHKIPRLTEIMKINGWALNTEYFTEIMHLLRAQSESLRYRSIVEELVWYPSDADTRDTEAVLRVCTAYLKLFFPHAADRAVTEQTHFRQEFNRYCLRPARLMRDIIRKQLRVIDPAEFGSKNIATYKLRGE
ncbi:MAG: BREX system Lon protease-like protein BrxL [Peptococcaceae bacterium]|jgi:ATP-dependent Lon protease|nr:BREX system Lon protease-like protein BrxL [Peptococcaceae bacterium]